MPPPDGGDGGVCGSTNANLASTTSAPLCIRDSSFFASKGGCLEAPRPRSLPCDEAASTSGSSLCGGFCFSTSTAMTRAPRRAVAHNRVPHCQQLFNWDCGLACVLMVVQAAGAPHCGYEVLRQLCPTTSIWTVDLAHLLHRFGLSVSFTTVTLGPNPAYVHECFYMEHMLEDEQRVSQLFVDAVKAGIPIQQRSLGSAELQEVLLSGEHLVIALVDKRKLDPWLLATEGCLPGLCGLDAGYAGHYILLVGYDTHLAEYLVRDPAAGQPDLHVSASAVDQARRSFGTDEDLLIVTLGQGCSAAVAFAAEGNAAAGRGWGGGGVAVTPTGAAAGDRGRGGGGAGGGGKVAAEGSGGAERGLLELCSVTA